jgi:FAD binding domain
MNTSIQDVINLSWKLAMVMGGVSLAVIMGIIRHLLKVI